MCVGELSVKAPSRQFGLWDGSAVIIGIVVGAGIYETSPQIAASLPGPAWLVPVWIVGALICMLGALCYAEIVTRLPRAGGDYAYLTAAYGPRLGFLFAWAEFWIMRPAHIGAIAFIFSHYANAVSGYDNLITPAVMAVIGLTGVHLLGVRGGRWTQNLLAVVKLLSLLALAAAGLIWAEPPEEAPVLTADGDLVLAIILVLFTYGGWSHIAYIAVEVREPERNILRSLLLGIGSVGLIYVLVNLAFMHTLGFSGMANADSVAADMLGRVMGSTGATVISLLICLSCLGNINGMILTGSRILYAVGCDHPGFAWLGRWHGRLDAPVAALLLQMTIAVALVVLLGSSGRGFERLVIFSTPLFWAFFTLVALALFVFRKRSSAPAGYRAPLYPVLPGLFVLFCAGMFAVSLDYAWGRQTAELVWVGMVLLAGLAVSRRSHRVR